MQDHNKNVPKLDLTKSGTKMQPVSQRNENASKKRTCFQGPKDMDMLQFHATNNVFVTVFLPTVTLQISEKSAISMCPKYRNVHVFFFFRTDVFSLQSHATTRAENSPPGSFCNSFRWVLSQWCMEFFGNFASSCTDSSSPHACTSTLTVLPHHLVLSACT